jgi:subtilisin family serine protease
MKRRTVILVMIFLATGLPLRGLAQKKGVSVLDSLDLKYLNWYNLDPSTDRVQGASINKAYTELLAGKTPKTKIVVAVIDGGVDIDHEDLRGKIWTNPDEIAGNGVDDDQNGYPDDIHGWNFIGNIQGENILYENLEQVRIFRKLDAKYRHVNTTEGFSPDEKEEFTLYRTCREHYEKDLNEYTENGQFLASFESGYDQAETTVKEYLNQETFEQADLMKLKSLPHDVKQARDYLLYLQEQGITRQLIRELKENNRTYLEYRLNPAYDPRKIIADNPEDINDVHYGNNNVKGPAADHGTFVAGIIGANRTNGLGIDGIAQHVEIMVLRAVPNGDEWDKDIALAIRYAVNNGARIINLSFGKDYSPQKEFVDHAIRYADAHGVLMVHAAGNDAVNLDVRESYPTRKLKGGDEVANWLAVGATTDRMGKRLVCDFSNYGKLGVDLFAPGENIISLSPGNTYQINDGTSFSCPVVTGVAALVWSYYPELSTGQLREILLHSTTRYPRMKVYSPQADASSENTVRFSDLSRTGGIVNAYEALNLAKELSP